MDRQRLTFGRSMLWIYAVAMILFLLVPILIIVITSFGNSTYMQFPPRVWSLRWYREFFHSERWIDSTLLSVRVAIATSVLASVIGTTAALGIVRGKTKLARAAEIVLVSPMVAPTIVLAIALYFMFSRLHLVDSAYGLILGHTVVATPLVLITVAAALRTIDRSLEFAARSLGAGIWSSLWYVTLPTIRPAILGGAAFAFLTSFDEVIIAIFIGGPDATTLPKRMWDGIRFEVDPTLTAIASLLVLLAVIILITAELCRRLIKSQSRIAIATPK